MPFKRAGWLQRVINRPQFVALPFQCPLSGLVGCNVVPCAQLAELPSFNAL